MQYSGKLFRLGEKIRLHEGVRDNHPPPPRIQGHVPKTLPEMCKESVFEPPILLQNQANPQILLHFQANFTDSLQKSGARLSVSRRAVGAPRVWRETPPTSSGYAQESPVPTRSEYRAEGTYEPRRVTRCRQRLPELRRLPDQHQKRLAMPSQ